MDSEAGYTMPTMSANRYIFPTFYVA